MHEGDEGSLRVDRMENPELKGESPQARRKNTQKIVMSIV